MRRRRAPDLAPPVGAGHHKAKLLPCRIFGDSQRAAGGAGAVHDLKTDAFGGQKGREFVAHRPAQSDQRQGRPAHLMDRPRDVDPAAAGIKLWHGTAQLFARHDPRDMGGFIQGRVQCQRQDRPISHSFNEFNGVFKRADLGRVLVAQRGLQDIAPRRDAFEVIGQIGLKLAVRVA